MDMWRFPRRGPAGPELCGYPCLFTSRKHDRAMRSSSPRSSLISRLGVLLACAVMPASSWALGTRVVDQNAEATSRGDAFAATADNPSAIYYNPAGITQLRGTQVLLGAYAVTYNNR